MEQTLVVVKPDGVRRGLVGQILARIEARGYVLVAGDFRHVTASFLAEHYREHEGKPFVPLLLEFMSSGPVFAAVAQGQGVVPAWRSMMGPTDPTAAPAGTIRGDWARDWGQGSLLNLVHGSDSAESAAREVALWFPHLHG